MCIRKWLDEKTGEWDSTREMEDVYIYDWCMGRLPYLDEGLGKSLIHKQHMENKNIFRKLVWSAQAKLNKNLIEYDKSDCGDLEELPF